MLILYTDKMNSLSDYLDILLETLSKSDIQLLNRRVTDDLGDDEHRKTRALLLPTLPISRAIAHALEIPLTLPLR